MDKCWESKNATSFDGRCEYYTNEQFNQNIIMDNVISIIHFNSRSLISNHSKTLDCLAQFSKKFTVIAVSETWLDGDHNLVKIDGYDMYCINRNKKREGGVAFNTDNNYKCRIISELSLALDNIMECIAIELEAEKSKNLQISCIYRTPGSCIKMFTEEMLKMYNPINNKKMTFICGDFNIDLLNPTVNSAITDFVHTMYSISLYPLICCRPTRITSHSATLIDNIFTIVVDRNVESGIIINDLSDHLPVFATV